MKTADLEAAVLRLAPDARARLARRLLDSLEVLSEEEVEKLWAEEAQRRDREMDEDPSIGHDFSLAIEEAEARFG